MANQANQAEFVKLCWDDQRELRYTTQDSHIGITTVENAVRKLQFADVAIDAISYLEDVKAILLKWVSEHNEKIEKAFLTLQDNHFLFLVVTKTNSFDDKFEDELSDLDINIASMRGNVNFSVQSLPNCSKEQYRSFLDARMTLECRMHNANSR